MEELMQEPALLVTIIILGIALLLMMIVNAAIRLKEFCRELDYLNREIVRTAGEEQAQWKRRKRRLLLSLIPFVGR